MTASYLIYQSVNDADKDGEQVEAYNWECINLRDAVNDLTATRTSHVDGVRYRSARYTAWNASLYITVQNGMEYLTGLEEERCLCVVGISRHSARRLSRLLQTEWSAQ